VRGGSSSRPRIDGSAALRGVDCFGSASRGAETVTHEWPACHLECSRCHVHARRMPYALDVLPYSSLRVTYAHVKVPSPRSRYAIRRARTAMPRRRSAIRGWMYATKRAVASIRNPRRIQRLPWCITRCCELMTDSRPFVPSEAVEMAYRAPRSAISTSRECHPHAT
jgi:hypothetical protein